MAPVYPKVNMRFTVTYYGQHDFNAATYTEVNERILERHRTRQKICGFRLSLSNYAVIDNHEEQ